MLAGRVNQATPLMKMLKQSLDAQGALFSGAALHELLKDLKQSFGSSS
jgi:hypothetical protein